MIAGGVGAFAAWYLFRTTLGEVADFQFELGKVGGASVEERAPEAELQEAAEQIRDSLSDMYTVGFVDPGKWRNGSFPELYRAFVEEIEPKVREDLDNLSVGSDAANIESVDPISGRLSVRFLINAEQELIGATAHTTFAANATAASDGGPVAIQHDGTYYLEPVDDLWLINAYDVEGIVTRVTQPLSDEDAES